MKEDTWDHFERTDGAFVADVLRLLCMGDDVEGFEDYIDEAFDDDDKFRELDDFIDETIKRVTSRARELVKQKEML